MFALFQIVVMVEMSTLESAFARIPAKNWAKQNVKKPRSGLRLQKPAMKPG